MSDEDQWTRRSLARMVEAGLHFFGVANLEQFEGLLDDAQQRAMLRNWLRSEHVPRGAAAGVADHSTQTAAVTMVSVSTAAATTSGSRLVSVASQASVHVAQRESQASVRVAQRASQVNVAVPVANAAVDCSTNTISIDEIKTAALATATREARASMEPIILRSIEVAKAAELRISGQRDAVQKLRAATHASNERCAAEAAAAAADRASVTRRERTLQADLESEKDLRVRAQSRVDQLKSELIDQQVLLQQTMDQLEKTREMSEC